MHYEKHLLHFFFFFTLFCYVHLETAWTTVQEQGERGRLFPWQPKPRQSSSRGFFFIMRAWTRYVWVCPPLSRQEARTSPSNAVPAERERERERERAREREREEERQRERNPIMHCMLQGWSRADSSVPVWGAVCVCVCVYERTHTHTPRPSARETHRQAGR